MQLFYMLYQMDIKGAKRFLQKAWHYLRGAYDLNEYENVNRDFFVITSADAIESMLLSPSSGSFN